MNRTSSMIITRTPSSSRRRLVSSVFSFSRRSLPSTTASRVLSSSSSSSSSSSLQSLLLPSTATTTATAKKSSRCTNSYSTNCGCSRHYHQYHTMMNYETTRQSSYISSKNLRIKNNAIHDANNNKNTASAAINSFSSLATTNEIAHDNNEEHSNNSNNNNIIPFILADIGEGISEVELLQWYVQEGDVVQQFDRICEVQSDKATVEISSRYDGIIHHLGNKNVGDMINVGSPLCYIDITGKAGSESVGNVAVEANATTTIKEESDGNTQTQTLHNINDEEDKLHIPNVASKFNIAGDDDNIDEDKTTATATATATAADKSEEEERQGGGRVNNGGGNKVLATPAVRKLGMDYNIDLNTIIGTGPKGRVLKSDIIQLLKDTSRWKEKDDSNDKKTKEQQQQDDTSTTGRKAEEEDEDDEVIVKPIRGYNRLMIKSMTMSLQIPQMVYSDEINMTNLHTYRKELLLLQQQQQESSSSSEQQQQKKKKISYLPFVIKSLSLSLNDYPVCNSTLNTVTNDRSNDTSSSIDYTLTYHKNHNIGIAMDTKKGLVVPVIKSCQVKSILDISHELDHLQQMATEGNLSESDLSNATFTISNIGTIGGTYMSPIVTPPQVAIGAMGKIQRLPRFVNNTSKEVQEVYIMNMSWGGDHRVIDGATMAKFSNKFKSYMENPISMIMTMK